MHLPHAHPVKTQPTYYLLPETGTKAVSCDRSAYKDTTAQLLPVACSAASFAYTRRREAPVVSNQ